MCLKEECLFDFVGMKGHIAKALPVISPPEPFFVVVEL